MMPAGEAREGAAYRQMELNPQMADGAAHSPENVTRQMEQARQQAEFYEQQRAQWEAQRRELEVNSERKALFDANLNEVGMKLHNAVGRLERELESMGREREEIVQFNECLKRHLQILSALQPKNWSPEGFEARLREALAKLDRAESDFDEAYSIGRNFRHTRVFLHKPGEEPVDGVTWKKLGREMLRGLAFHLPLFLLLLVTWIVVSLVNS